MVAQFQGSDIISQMTRPIGENFGEVQKTRYLTKEYRVGYNNCCY